jgi:hypothetical protein
MKKSLATFIGILALGANATAWAGPDFRAIEQARKAKQARQDDRVAGSGIAATKCPPGRLVPMVDHGPRAQVTPDQNRLRRERHEAHLRACGLTAVPSLPQDEPGPS